jgi:alkylation response protein AidB-like acyl-CoA dehydrogenase
VSVRTSGGNADAEGISLVLVDGNAPGVSRRDYRTVDGQRASDVRFSNVRVPAEAVLGELGEGLPLLERVLDSGLGALAAEAVGLMSFMQRTTLAYLKAREQFGVPIGSFQALQHRAVDMLIQLELARSIVYYGTMALVEDGDARSRGKALSATKVQVSRSGRYVGQQAIQLHGGIGMSEEYAVGHYFKRMSMLELALGDVNHHLRRYVRLGRELAAAPPAESVEELVPAGV